MEARSCRVIAQVTSIVSLLFLISTPAYAESGGYRTKNFVVSVSPPSAALAKEVGDMAEKCRHDLSIEWLGSEMPPWSTPCPIHATVAPTLGAGGATSFVFDRGEVFNWKMNIQGSRERVLDSVMPHEVTHTIFASYFRCPPAPLGGRRRVHDDGRPERSRQARTSTDPVPEYRARHSI